MRAPASLVRVVAAVVDTRRPTRLRVERALDALPEEAADLIAEARHRGLIAQRRDGAEPGLYAATPAGLAALGSR